MGNQAKYNSLIICFKTFPNYIPFTYEKLCEYYISSFFYGIHKSICIFLAGHFWNRNHWNLHVSIRVSIIVITTCNRHFQTFANSSNDIILSPVWSASAIVLSAMLPNCNVSSWCAMPLIYLFSSSYFVNTVTWLHFFSENCCRNCRIFESV